MCLQPSVWRICVGGVSPACGVKTLMHSWGREHSSLLGFGYLFICFKMIWGLSGRVPPLKKTKLLQICEADQNPGFTSQGTETIGWCKCGCK